MEIIDGHLIDNKLLAKGDWILDAGCIGFGLEYKYKKKYQYLCVDPNPTIKPLDYVNFENIALMPFEGEVNYCGWSTGEGNYCYKEEAPWYADLNILVPCSTVRSLMSKYKIEQFGLAKIDIEGGEYDFLLSIDFPFAKQIAVEFHQCVGHNPYGTHDEYITKLMESPFGQIYEIAESYEYKHCKGLYEYNFKLK
jgi:FkbM family methyltransferase